jgi:hypothetical protein
MMRCWTGPTAFEEKTIMSEEVLPRYDELKSLLLWRGKLGNARLRALLGVKVSRGSQLIRAFREAHPTWTEWDSESQSFRATPAAYRGTFDATASLNEYLSMVGITHVEGGQSGLGMIWNAFPDLSTPNAPKFAQVSEAIERSRRMRITYRTMLNPDAHPREISPHSLVRAGRKWHVRAFCNTRQMFQDFALSRIEAPRILDTQSEQPLSDDLAWNTVIDVRFVAHPGLNQAQQKLVRLEHLLNSAARVEACRAAMVSYFIHDLRAATDPSKQLPPDYQLAVENLGDLQKWMLTGEEVAF